MEQVFITKQYIDQYLQSKSESGVTTAACRKYKGTLKNLLIYLNNTPATKEILADWRNYLTEKDYSKVTIQRYITVANDFLRWAGHSELCISKPIPLDLTGKTFGYLTAINIVKKGKGNNYIWHCVCKCGNEIDVAATLLTTGNTTSCGCLNKEILDYANRYVDGTSLRWALKDDTISKTNPSGFTGVFAKRDKWVVIIAYKGKRYYLGTYSNIEDAVKARARAKELIMEDAEKLFKETDHLYTDKPSRAEPPLIEKSSSATPKTSPLRTKRNDNTSGYTGISFDDNKWIASISFKGVRYKLGRFENIEAAVKIRKQAEEYVAIGDIDKLKEISTNIHHN